MKIKMIIIFLFFININFIFSNEIQFNNSSQVSYTMSFSIKFNSFENMNQNLGFNINNIPINNMMMMEIHGLV